MEWVDSMLQLLRRNREGFLQLLFPPVCLSCQRIIRASAPLNFVCLDCFNTLSPVRREFIQQAILHRLAPVYLDDLHIAVFFNPLTRVLIHQIKYAGMNHLARCFAREVFRNFPFPYSPAENAVVVPVPLHPLRRKERGYNQSEWIARGLFRDLHLPILTDLLRRIRHTRSQTRLNREERKENVREAFRCRESSRIAGRTVLLVDDVVTTGATMNECARVLKDCGANRVVGFALATPMLNDPAVDSEV